MMEIRSSRTYIDLVSVRYLPRDVQSDLSSHLELAVKVEHSVYLMMEVVSGWGICELY